METQKVSTTFSGKIETCPFFARLFIALCSALLPASLNKNILDQENELFFPAFANECSISKGGDMFAAKQ